MGRTTGGARWNRQITAIEQFWLLSARFGGNKRNLIKGHRDIMNATLAPDSERAADLIERHFAPPRLPDQEQCRDVVVE